MSFSSYQCIKTGFRRFFLLFVSVASFAQAQSQLPNLTDPAPAARFAITDKVWPSSPGGASICLWADDKLAALSISVDDNSAQNIDWWLQQAAQNDFKVTWFVISGFVGDSNPGAHGTWQVYSNVLAQGQDVQSHSVTHSNSVAEYRDSQIQIEANLPGHKCEFLAYPGGTPAGTMDPAAAAQYYAGARGGVGTINIANKIPYMSSCGMSSFNLNTPANSWSYLPNLFVTNSPYYRGWAVQLFHYISDYSATLPLIDFYVANKDKLWSAAYGDMSKYGQERDTATLTVTTNTADLIKMTLTDQMLDSRFNYPLTIKVRLPASWANVQATQNGSLIESTVIQNAGASYALVKAVPDQGEIALTSASGSFIATPTSGWAPLTVTFTDISASETTTNRFWDFGDGFTTNVTSTNVTHVYTSPGTSTVRLIASDASGSWTNTQADYIIVTVPVTPTAGFNVSTNAGSAPLTVTLSDISTGDITNRFWDFGDGTTTNITSVGIVHTYTSAGTNTVKLIVSGPAGVSTNTQVGAVTVTAPVPPAAAFSATPTSGSSPLPVTFTDTSSGSITNRFWSFGDGATTNTTATTVSHTYTLAGTNTVQLIVSGPFGANTNTQSNLIRVEPGPAENVINATADKKDVAMSGDGTVGWGGATTERVGFDSVTKKSDVLIIPFALPVLPVGESITSASFSINVTAGQSVFGGEPNWNVDLYGIRGSSSAAAVWASDFYDGAGDSAHTKLADNFISVLGNTVTPTGTYTAQNAAIVAWLQSFYTGNTPNQAYVFFRINPDVAYLSYTNSGGYQVASRYLTVASADNTTAALKPVLSITSAAVPAPSGDANSDGIPDSWSTLYFGGPTNANASAQAANGINTILESYIAGLDPTNPASVLSVSNDWNVLRWNATSGRVYSVWSSSNLLDGFQCLESNIVWPQSSWTGQVGAAQGGDFYQLKVQLAP